MKTFDIHALPYETMKEDDLLQQRIERFLDDELTPEESADIAKRLQSDEQFSEDLTRLRLARYAVHLQAVEAMRERIKRWRKNSQYLPSPVSPTVTACILAVLFSILWSGDPGTARTPVPTTPVPVATPAEMPIAALPLKGPSKPRKSKKNPSANTPPKTKTIAQSSMKTIVVETEGNLHSLLAQRDEFLSKGVQIEAYELSQGKIRFQLLLRDPDFGEP
jgi:hypothetical protein